MLLEKTKRENKMKNLLFFDTESHLVDAKLNGKEIQIHKPYLICSSFYPTIQSEVPEKIFHYTVTDFQHYMLSLVRKHKSLNLFAHNMKYDSLIVRAISFLSGSDFDISAISFSNPFFIYARNKAKKYKMAWISSTNIFQESLESLGDKIGLPKLDFDHDDLENFDMEKAKIYCKRDVEILEKVMIDYYKFLDSTLNAKKHTSTIASQSLNIFIDHFMNTEIDIHEFEEPIEIERKSYKGGRTECFRIGEYKDLFYYDINSMYPHVMIDNIFPVRYETTRKICMIDDLKKILNDGYLVCAECDISIDKPCIGKKIDGKLCFPVGEFTETLCTPEIKYLLEHKGIKAVRNVCIYKGEKIFSEYIDYFYKSRLKAKSEKSYYEHFFKLFMNSLYGKFGQRKISWEVVDSIDDKMLIKEHIYIEEKEDGKKEYHFQKVFNGKVWEQIEAGNAKTAFVAVASHVTAYARMCLWEVMETAGLKNLYYCDTDSVMVNKAGQKKIEVAGMIDPNKLGKLKEEGKIQNINIRNLKDYYIRFYPKNQDDKGEILDKKKGLPKKNTKEIANNCYEVTYWNGYANFIKLGSDEFYYTEKRQKVYNTNYSKGVVKDGKVKPFEMEGEIITNVKEN